MPPCRPIQTAHHTAFRHRRSASLIPFLAQEKSSKQYGGRYYYRSESGVSL